MKKFFNNVKLEMEIEMDFTKSTVTTYNNNSTVIIVYTDKMTKLYLSDVKGVRKMLDKILYKYSNEVYLNLNRIYKYEDSFIHFDNGSLYKVVDSHKINFESSWRSFKIKSFYDNDIN